jgi:hypothetical protein
MDDTCEDFGMEFNVSNSYPYYSIIDDKSREIMSFKYFTGNNYTHPPRYERKFGYTSITG